jgi:general stress protein 26
MEPDRLLLLARELINDVTFCFAISGADNGDTNARIVQPRKPTDDWAVDFLTNRRCRKVREIRRSGKMTLAYQHERDRGYVCLVGRASIIDDVELKRSRWVPAADRWNPGGPDDPAVVYARLETQRIELWSAVRGVVPEPPGYSAAVLVRDGDVWRYSTT